MYALISSYYYALINGIIMRTQAIYRIQIIASLSDEDAVYLIESVVGGLHICNRVQSPTVCEAFNLRTKTETMTVLLGVGLHRLSGSWPSRVV